MAVPLGIFASSQPIFVQVFGQSFCMVAIAELFDKTWFVALLMAMNHPKHVVFWGCYMALAAHTLIAAGFGFLVSKAMSFSVLHFAAALVYGVFAILYARDFYNADPSGDMISAGKEEAGLAIPTGYGSAGEDKKRSEPQTKLKWTQVFGQCFVAMFIAEWGDRTQIAMIGQHASQPLVPVLLGSLLAFFVLTGSAVATGALLSNQKVSERLVYLVSAVAFGVFAVLAVHDGLSARLVDMR